MLIAPPNTDDGPCRACGAVRAAPGRLGICENCFNKCARHYPWNTQLDQDHINAWLVKQLVNTAKQYAAGEPVIRCEAMSNVHGYQCANKATKKIDGRNLCANHARIEVFHFVDQETVPSWYHRVEGIIRTAAEADPLFREAVKRGLETT